MDHPPCLKRLCLAKLFDSVDCFEDSLDVFRNWKWSTPVNLLQQFWEEIHSRRRNLTYRALNVFLECSYQPFIF